MSKWLKTDKLVKYLVSKIQRERLYKTLVYYPASKRGEPSADYLNFIVKTYDPADWVVKLEAGMHVSKKLTAEEVQLLHMRLDRLKTGWARELGR